MSTTFEKNSTVEKIYECVFWGRLPKDARLFTLGNLYQDSCIFCGEDTDYDQSRLVLFSEEDGHRHEVSACNNCQDLFHNATASHSEPVRQRVYYLAVHGIMPEYAEKEGYYDDGDMRGHCVLCQHRIPFHRLSRDGDTAYGAGYIAPPYDANWKKVRCFTSVCEFCSHELELRLQGQDLFSDYAVDGCAKCSQEYAVTADELRYRKGMGSLGEHLCPECLNSAGVSGIQRFENASCCISDCPNTAIVDVTHERFIENLDSTFYCELHSPGGEHLAIVEHLKIVAKYESEKQVYYFCIIYMDSMDPRKDAEVYDGSRYEEFYNEEYNALYYGCLQAHETLDAIHEREIDSEYKTPNVYVGATLHAIDHKIGGEE